jgi:hypothetical protein
MAKLRTPTGDNCDMWNTVVVYADGIDEIDHYGLNARLMAERSRSRRATRSQAACRAAVALPPGAAFQ